MKSIHSLTYTNVALTVLIVLLGVLVVRPYVAAPKAIAADITNIEEQMQGSLTRDTMQSADRRLETKTDSAAATYKVADATLEVAKAIREEAKAQQEVAKAIARLAGSK